MVSSFHRELKEFRVSASLFVKGLVSLLHSLSQALTCECCSCNGPGLSWTYISGIDAPCRE